VYGFVPFVCRLHLLTVADNNYFATRLLFVCASRGRLSYHIILCCTAKRPRVFADDILCHYIIPLLHARDRRGRIALLDDDRCSHRIYYYTISCYNIIFDPRIRNDHRVRGYYRARSWRAVYITEYRGGRSIILYVKRHHKSIFPIFIIIARQRKQSIIILYLRRALSSYIPIRIIDNAVCWLIVLHLYRYISRYLLISYNIIYIYYYLINMLHDMLILWVGRVLSYLLRIYMTILIIRVTLFIECPRIYVYVLRIHAIK